MGMEKRDVITVLLLCVVLFVSISFVYAVPISGGVFNDLFGGTPEPTGPVEPGSPVAPATAGIITGIAPVSPVSTTITITPATKVEPIKGVSYYLKLLNKNILLDTTSSKLAEAFESATKIAKGRQGILSDLSKAPGTRLSAPTGKAVATKTNSVVWKDLLTIGIPTIQFPEVEVDGAKYALQLDYRPGNFRSLYQDGVGVTLYKDGSRVEVDCYPGDVEGWWNSYGGQHVLLFTGTESIEPCKQEISNDYLVDVELVSEGSKMRLNLKSPLVPDSCEGKMLSQNEAIGGVLTVTEAMCKNPA
jgi:hypothetical protein